MFLFFELQILKVYLVGIFLATVLQQTLIIIEFYSMKISKQSKVGGIREKICARLSP